MQKCHEEAVQKVEAAKTEAEGLPRASRHNGCQSHGIPQHAPENGDFIQYVNTVEPGTLPFRAPLTPWTATGGHLSPKYRKQSIW